MLEEALKNEKTPPAEVALLALQFVQSQLPAGGTSAENRFFRLFVPLCNVIFGPILDKQGNYRHADGGWMSAQQAWSRTVNNTNNNTSSSVTSSSSSAGSSSNRRPPVTSGVGIGRTLIHTSSNSSSQSSSANDCQADPVFQLLGTSNNNKVMTNPSSSSYSLIDAISKETTFAFPLPFHALPKTTRDAWMALVEASLLMGNNIGQQLVAVNVNPSICSPNTARLLGEMSRRRPAEQTELIEYRAQQMAQQSHNIINNSNSPQSAPHLFQAPIASHHTGFYSPTAAAAAAAAAATSPVAAAAGAAATSSNINSDFINIKKDQEPKVIFGMLEYYLILFLRYPLAVPVPKTYTSSSSSTTTPAPQGYTSSSTTRRTSSSSSTTSSSRVSRRGDAIIPYGERLYISLFRNYVKHFLPYERDENHRHLNFSNNNNANNRDSEFFLRATITLWMETQGQVKTTNAIVESMLLLQRRRHHHHRQAAAATAAQHEVDFFNLNASYDLIQVIGAYDPPPALIQQCLRYLVAQVISDPTLHSQVMSLSGQQQQRTGETPGSSTSTSSSLLSCWSLTSAMTALQQPFYNIIRINLRYATIHSSDSPFFSALSLWLLWLEPWNVKEYKVRSNFSPRNATQRLMGSVSGQQQQQRSPLVQRKLDIPKHDQPSRYHDKWEPYIAANLYLYVVPLAIFLRRARELDFSETKFQSSMKVVQRVFRVFSPAVVQVLSRHLAAASLSGTSSSSSSSSNNAVLRRHLESLGVHAPPISSSVGSSSAAASSSSSPPMMMTMESCQGDMICLLEEIQMQHLKKVRELDVWERTSAYLEGFFGKGVVSGEEKTLDSIVERARLIVNLPLDFDLAFSSKSESTRATAGSSASEMAGTSNRPVTNQDGYLTDVGKCQLLTGAVKCSPVDITYHGETMNARSKSHELAPLLQLTAWASDWVYTKTHWRLELRFLADYRNLWCLSLLAFILYTGLRYKFAG